MIPPEAKENDKGRLTMNPTDEELQKVANYRLVRKTLRPGGIGSIVFGVIAIVMGISGIEDNVINVILALIGCFLTIEGIWLVSAPVPAGMIVDGIALLILGIWNIFVTIANELTANTGGPAILGILQILWGIQSFRRYGSLSKMPQTKPTSDTLHRIDEIVKQLKAAKMTDDPNLVEFQTKTFTSRQVWKGRLAGANAVFTENSGKDLIFAKKDDVDFVKKGKVLIGKTLKATFGIRDRNLKGTISPEAFKRYEQWKSVTE